MAFTDAIAYINLQTAQVEQTYPNVAVGTGTVILGNGYIYVLPLSGSSISVNISSGQVTTGASIQTAPGAIFDSAVNNVYGSNSSLLGRYNATGALGSFVSQPSTYSGAFRVCGPLSLSEDGGTVYMGCGAIFRASDDTAQDMTYLGVLPGIQNVQSMVHSSALNQVAVIQKAPSLVADYDTVVRPFDSTFFNWIGQLATTPFLINGASYLAHGRWVFYNSSSNALLIITQADSQAALTNDFAIENVDLHNANSCNALFGGSSTSIGAAGSYATTPICRARIVCLRQLPMHLGSP